MMSVSTSCQASHGSLKAREVQCLHYSVALPTVSNTTLLSIWCLLGMEIRLPTDNTLNEDCRRKIVKCPGHSHNDPQTNSK